ncbi:MAG: NADH-quinone oxidoreductase subunit M, partial [Alphaproteobacteria bacterium]
RREIAIFAPLVMAVLWMGIYPSSFLDAITVSAQNLTDNYAAALKAAGLSPPQVLVTGVIP